MRFHLLPQSGLEFPIRNTSAQQVSGKFALELLNLEDDSVAATLSGTFTEQPGETIEKIAWPVEQLPSDTPSELGWYRLRYTFTPDASATAAPVTGIVQLEQSHGWFRNQHGRGAKRGAGHQVSGASPCENPGRGKRTQIFRSTYRSSSAMTTTPRSNAKREPIRREMPPCCFIFRNIPRTRRAR